MMLLREDARVKVGLGSVQANLSRLRVGMSPEQAVAALELVTIHHSWSFASGAYENRVYALDDGAQIHLIYLAIEVEGECHNILHSVRSVQKDRSARTSGTILFGSGREGDSVPSSATSLSKTRDALALLPQLEKGMALCRVRSTLGLTWEDRSGVVLNVTGLLERYDLPDGRAVVLKFEHGFSAGTYAPRYAAFRIVEQRGA